MNINRRQFLQVLGLGATVAVLPKTAMALPAPNKSNVIFKSYPLKPGNYVFSYFLRMGGGEWGRVIKNIRVDDEMILPIRVDLDPGVSVSVPQLEQPSEQDYPYGGCISYPIDHNPPVLNNSKMTIAPGVLGSECSIFTAYN